MEQAPGIRRDRFKIPTLRLGVERPECERRLARSGDTGEDHQRIAGDLEVDVLEVMLAGPANANEARHPRRMG